MDHEFVQMVVANFPNFAGLLVLAWVLNQNLKEARKEAKECEERYERLVDRMLKHFEEDEDHLQ